MLTLSPISRSNLQWIYFHIGWCVELSQFLLSFPRCYVDTYHFLGLCELDFGISFISSWSGVNRSGIRQCSTGKRGFGRRLWETTEHESMCRVVDLPFKHCREINEERDEELTRFRLHQQGGGPAGYGSWASPVPLKICTLSRVAVLCSVHLVRKNEMNL